MDYAAHCYCLQIQTVFLKKHINLLSIDILINMHAAV